MLNFKWVLGCGVALISFAALGSMAVDAFGQTPAKPGADELVVKGLIRHKPVDAPPPLEVFTHLPKYEQVALSPDGGQFAFITTLEGEHLLVTYRFADKTRQVVKLGEGDISAIAWADAGHVLVESARTGMRGTCVEVAQTGQATATARAVMAVADSSGSLHPEDTAIKVAAMPILAALHTTGCVYFGLRSQTAITSVNMAQNTGRVLGASFNELDNLSLGIPDRVSVSGQSRLIGPYVEMRAKSVNNQPAQRVYLWQADAETGLGKLINDGGGDLDRENRYPDDWLMDPQGGLVARTVYDFTSRVFSVQMKIDGAWKSVMSRTIVDGTHAVAPFLIGLGRDPNSIVIFDAAEGNTVADRHFHYYQLSADGKLSAPLEPSDATSDRPMFDPVTGRLAGFVEHGQDDVYHLSDPKLQTLFEQAQNVVAGETARIVATATDPKKMVIYAQGGVDPGAYYYVDFNTGHSEAIGEDYADIPTDWVASQEQISYPAADGLNIHAILTLPPRLDDKNLALVVLPHDGPSGHDALGFDWLAQVLASRGYLVLQPNYRGSNDGQDMVAAGKGEWGRKMQSDLADGVRYLVAQGKVDRKRVCIVGAGYGGYAALEAAATDGATYRCAASINGIFDIAAFTAHQKGRMAIPEQDEMTSLVPDATAPRAFAVNPDSPRLLAGYLGMDTPSPLKQANGVSIPVLLIASSDDVVVPASQSGAMRDALRNERKAVDYVEIKGAGHVMATQASRLNLATALTDFLGKQNPAE